MESKEDFLKSKNWKEVGGDWQSPLILGRTFNFDLDSAYDLEQGEGIYSYACTFVLDEYFRGLDLSKMNEDYQTGKFPVGESPNY